MDPELPPAQEAEAQRRVALLPQATAADLLGLARLLAAKADRDLLGPTAVAVRDRVPRIGAQALRAARAGRKNGGPTGRAEPVRTATRRPSSGAGSPSGS